MLQKKLDEVSTIKSQYSKYIDYIKNISRPCKIEWFDDDWNPVGRMIRKEMEKLGLIIYKEGCIKLT
jgi:hypothetical protein